MYICIYIQTFWRHGWAKGGFLLLLLFRSCGSLFFFFLLTDIVCLERERERDVSIETNHFLFVISMSLFVKGDNDDYRIKRRELSKLFQ